LRLFLCFANSFSIMDEDVGMLLDAALEGKSIDLNQLREANGQPEVFGDSKKSRSKSKSVDRSRKRRSRTPERRRSRSRDRTRKREASRDKDRHRRRRSRTRSPRRRSRSRDRRRRSPSPSPRRNRRYSRSPVRRHSPSWRRSPPRNRLPGPERRDVMPFTAHKSPPPGAKIDMTPEERDQRTIFILQLGRETRPEHLEDFFSAVGHVRDVRIITDSKTRRSKGIAYIEFWDREAIPLAMGLNGQKLRGVPLVIQQTCAERNRLANGTVGSVIGFGPKTGGPLKLCVNNLHSSINDDMLTAVFEPFGRLERCYIEEFSPGHSKGIGYVVFRNADDGKKALEQLNNFEIAGKNIRVTTVEELSSTIAAQQAEVDAQAMEQEDVPEFATQCFMLSNMFDPFAETEQDWDLDVRDDVIEECNANGGAVHVFVDKKSEGGNVYVKCPNVLSAHRSVTALHGRVFAGKVITANYVPANSYHDLFPESRNSIKLLYPRVK